MKLSWGMLSWYVALSVSVSAQTNTVIVPVSNTVRSPVPWIQIDPGFAASDGWLLTASDSWGAALMIGGDASGGAAAQILPYIDLGGIYGVTYGGAYDLDGDRALVYDYGSAMDLIPPRVFSYRRSGSQWTFDAGGVLVETSLSSFLGEQLKVDGERSLLGDLGGAQLYGAGPIQFLYPDGWAFFYGIASMDISGDTVVMGVPSRGSALVYIDRPGIGYQLRHILRSNGAVTGSDVVPPQASGCFGISVAISGDSILVGDTDQGSSPRGRVRVFRGTGTAGMAWVGDLRASDEASITPNTSSSCFYRFGSGLEASETRLLVSAPRFPAAQSASYLFEQSPDEPTGWKEAAKFVPADGHSGLTFGSKAQLDGDRVWIHANRQGSFGPTGVAMYLDLPTGGIEYSAICHGDGGGAPSGCTLCPCGNDQAAGSVGGCLNSLGIGARLAAKGRASLSSDTLAMEISGALSESFALLAMGSAAAPSFPGAPCPPGSGVTNSGLDGLLCLGGNLERLSPRAVDENGEVGVTNDGWGEGSTPLIAGRGFVAGQSVYYQAIYRDAPTGGSACGTQLNTTNALRVVVQP